MGLLTILKKMKQKEKEVRLLMLGLDNAGKTTILKKFNGEDIDTISPTLGFNIKTLDHRGLKLNVWDVGGQKSLRSYWRNYFESTDGLIWVVDSADKTRMADCAKELGALLQEERLLGATLLVFANKQMEKVSTVEVNITDIKYDNPTNSLLIDLEDRPKWKISCKDVLSLDERIDDVAPYFLCFFLERREEEGYAILKRLKVFTVFIEHEGVLHLRKYDNLIKKIKIGRLKDGVVLRKVSLVVEKDVADDDGDAETPLDALRGAGMEIKFVKLGKTKPTLVDLKKGDVEEVISFQPLDLAVEQDEARVEEVANDAEKVIEGEEEKEENLIKKLEESLVNDIVDTLVKGKQSAKDSNVPADAKGSGDDGVHKVASKDNNVNKDHSPPLTKAVTVENVGPANDINGSLGNGTAPVKRKKSRELKKKADVVKEEETVGDSVEVSSSSASATKSWHWSYYLIPAALIAIIAISVHLFREKTRVNDA